MATPISTQITPSLHPDNVQTIEGYNDPKIREVLGPVETAFSVAYQSVQAVYETKTLVAKNTALNDDAKLVQLDAFATKKTDAVTRNFDSVLNNLNKGINYIEAELAVALTEKAAASFGREIRDHVKGLTTPQRQEFIQRHIDSGDEQVVAGVLGAPPFLSGMDAGMQKTLTRFWNERQNPDKAKRLKAMQAAKAMVEDNAPKLFTAMAKAVGDPAGKAHNIRAAQAASDRALSV